MEKISNKYITIPNVVCNNNNLSVNSKYLYGWIQNEIFYGEFYKTIEDLNNILKCSTSTTRKVLKELKENKLISIEIINGNQRKITPLVSDSMIIAEKTKIESLKRKGYEEQKEETKKELIKQFMGEIK